MNQLSRCKPYLGTYVEITLAGDCDERDLIRLSDAGFERIGQIQALMNFHDPDSELSHINREAANQPIRISPPLDAVLRFALQLSEDSAGLFDPTRSSQPCQRGGWQQIELREQQIYFHQPVKIDLGGIAKGYAVDAAYEHIQQQAPAGALQLVVNAGGDLRMSSWRDHSVGVRHPGNPAALVELPMQGSAVATSASYYAEEGSVIIGDRPAKQNDSARSYSVFTDNCMTADALTKIVYLAPQPTHLLAHYHACASVLAADGTVAHYPDYQCS